MTFSQSVKKRQIINTQAAGHFWCYAAWKVRHGKKAAAHPIEDELLLTRQIWLLTEEEWAALRAADLFCPGIEELAKLHCLVEKSCDELARYRLALSVIKTMQKQEKGISSYTILPTSGCNARCVYCYEEEWELYHMTDADADRLVDFICETKREGKVRISWFGGKPLSRAQTTSRICRALTDRGIEFHGSIITNSTYLTPDMAKEAKELRHLNRAQVSMDGAREDYEKRKRNHDPARYNYDVAMNAVRLFAENGISVSIRCIYDAENLPPPEGLHRRLQGKVRRPEERFRVYGAALPVR